MKAKQVHIKQLIDIFLNQCQVYLMAVFSLFTKSNLTGALFGTRSHLVR